MARLCVKISYGNCTVDGFTCSSYEMKDKKFVFYNVEDEVEKVGSVFIVIEDCVASVLINKVTEEEAG